MKNKKKEVKFKVFDTIKFKRAEFIVTLVMGLIFLAMLIFAIYNIVFIPITLVTFAMLLFSICYYYIDDNSKRKMVYVLFTIGVLVVVAEVIFTLVNIL